MSHGATSTQHKMAARSFKLGNSGVKEQNNSTNGNGTLTSIWGNSIWSDTRDTPVSRDNMHSVASLSHDVEGKTGSGSLVDSSVSEDYAARSAWAAKRNAGTGRSVPNVRYPDANISQARSTSNAGLPTLSGASQGVMSFGTRPPTINLNSTAAQPSSSFGSAFAGSLTGRGNETQAPFNVYTKFDRPAPLPTESMHRKPDSAIGGWVESTTTPSPSDDRKPQFPMQYSRNGSMPTSRDGSLPPSRGEDMPPPTFTNPNHGRPSQRVTPVSSRAPSISSSRNGTYNPYFSVNADQVASGFSQVSLGGDSRPNTSYKQSNGYGSHVTSTSAAVRPPMVTRGSSYDRSQEIDDIELSHLNYLGADEFTPRSTNGFSSSLADRYLPGGAFEFRPGQPYMGNSVSSRPYHLPSGQRTPSDWQGFPNGAVSRRTPPAIPEQQAFLNPGLQQLMAAQLRNPYMYSPYALQLGNPYLGMLPVGNLGLDVPTASRDGPVGDGVQSALMYEFKSNTKTKRYELRDIYDHIAEFSGDQHGSRFIQTKLETANSDEKERVFREIEPNAIPLMTDVFGNYVIQKFFEHGDQTHKKILANKMRGQVLNLSLQMYGCRVVQKALDHVLVDQQAALISELENNVLKCVKDQNGNHVIQKAIERCPSGTIGFIINAFQGQVQHLSIHPYGCRVIQRCLEKCDLPSKTMIMAELMEGIPSMISDQFGNYVVQHIVCHDEGAGRQRVLDTVARGLEGYSKHKFASNVVEKCLERADDVWRHHVVIALAHSNQRRTEGEGVLSGMIKDNFGNYVIQKLLDTLCPEDYHIFLDALHPAMQVAKRTGCGKQVMSIDKKMNKFDTYRNGSLLGSNPIFGRPTPMNGFQLPLPTPPFASNYNSATTTPPPLTSDTQSLQSSGLPSVNGDAIEGAAVSRKGSEPSSIQSIDGVQR
ncbi:Pumilio-like 4 [Pseudocercospora fuligena]|uniref:Pumilio homology domain family member 3 n=1 Tax=Pseudocercospora fuligena TaxID=685502 RepID=A0A8H6RQD7_9PEZI|nr:Pumilio-like 4 [Pseudocercospora fuligena]